MILKSTSKKFEPSVKGFNSLEDAIKHNEPIKLNLPPYVHQVPDFPDWTNKNKKVMGKDVNLFFMTCSCDDFLDSVPLYDGRDVRKVCVHLYFGLKRHWNKILDELTKLIIEYQFKYGPEILYRLNEKIIIGTKPKTSWVSIYSFEENEWRKHSYDLKEKRFSYGYKNEELLSLLLGIKAEGV